MNFFNYQAEIFNTLSGNKETLKAIDPKHLKIYVCGPTVYDRPHLGNARSLVIYDLFFRFFKKIFPQVTFVRNITDVDDKINAAAKEQKISIQQLTKKIIDLFYQDSAALKILRPTFEPKATEHISEMVQIIEKLIENKHAYVSLDHVIFDVNSCKSYGELSNRKTEEMIAGSRIEVADYKKNPLDFVLWKPADKNDDISSVFDSPWGKGRPGWHIECSAMSSKYLGENFDIHGGGADLQFPHHENEIAQSKCANHGSKYASYWIHNGFLTVNGEKMSKSLKNFTTVYDLLNQNFSGIVIRYFLLSTHYRKPLDFNKNAIEQATNTIEKFYSVLQKSDLQLNKKSSQKNQNLEIVIQHLCDDLNISKVISHLHNLVKEIKQNQDANLKSDLVEILDFLGLLDENFFDKKNELCNSQAFDVSYIESQIELRKKAKSEKNFIQADQIRNELLQKGVVIEDSANGEVKWHLSSK
jgi:cysteinyl-tRNA synthetase